MEMKTVHKWFWVWQFEEEERWLNEMALQGWALESVGFCTYTFLSCRPGEYLIRLEMHDGDEGYFSFMQELGAEYVGRFMNWRYFRRKTELGSFDLFSDIDSRIAHLDRIGKMLTAIGALNLISGLNPSNHLSWVNLLCCALLTYCLGRIHGKKEALAKERLLHE